MIHFFDPSNPRMAEKVPQLTDKLDVLLANLEDAIRAGEIAVALDAERWGVMPAPSPRQADVLVIMGYVTKKTLKVLIRLYHQMPEPRYVMVGCNCPATGGLYWDSYSTIKAIDEYLPVDIWVPGCMPRAEDWLSGFLKLRKKVFGGRVRNPRPVEELQELERMIYREVELREERMRRERG